ncbi:hypothetical protein B0H67DRAFT_385308 [Lasiosphaeris hirsuta]|uniref:Uncharacterized protein n=1 Tax=Lasiosphaeris hirsuta TaxID=260670 RepID=A0AA40DMP7_9PEZI|nr:hypothetical protein B0H67DRAFT_385308 [Lasiosphaeris hirsuta]
MSSRPASLLGDFGGYEEGKMKKSCKRRMKIKFIQTEHPITPKVSDRSFFNGKALFVPTQCSGTLSIQRARLGAGGGAASGQDPEGVKGFPSLSALVLAHRPGGSRILVSSGMSRTHSALSREAWRPHPTFKERYRQRSSEMNQSTGDEVRSSVDNGQRSTSRTSLPAESNGTRKPLAVAGERRARPCVCVLRSAGSGAGLSSVRGITRLVRRRCEAAA